MNTFALPRSSKKVLVVLSNSPLSFKEIKRKTRLPERTLRFAISVLKKRGIVIERNNFRDMRRKVFSVTGLRKEMVE